MGKYLLLPDALGKSAHHLFPGDQARHLSTLFPVFVTDWSAHDLSLGVVFTPLLAVTTAVPFPEQELQRRYVKRRLHQEQFRTAVIDSYAGKCAISKLPERRLLSGRRAP